MYMKVINLICFLSLHDVLLISKIVCSTQTVILLLVVIPLAITNAGTPLCLYCILHSPQSLNASLMFFHSLSLFFNLSLTTSTVRSLTSTAQCHLQLIYLLITNVTAAVIILETIAPFAITLLTAKHASE
jgi:hypothetical protein